jgi:hypothetical protein
VVTSWSQTRWDRPVRRPPKWDSQLLGTAPDQPVRDTTVWAGIDSVRVRVLPPELHLRMEPAGLIVVARSGMD